MFLLYKYKMYQKHISDCANCYAKQCVALPNVHNRRHRNANQLRNYVVYIAVFKIFEAINNQYSEYRHRQNIAVFIIDTGTGNRGTDRLHGK